MKKNLLMFVCAFFCATMVSASGWKVNDNGKFKTTSDNRVAKVRAALSSIKRVPLPLVTRAEGTTSYDGLSATSAQCWYYGDLTGDGSAYYYVLMSNGGITDSGIPEGPGQMLRVMICGKALENPDKMELPTGTFTFDEENYMGVGSIFSPDVTFIDAFWNPDEPESKELVGYVYGAGNTGKLEISKDADGKYTIAADMDLAIEDEETSAVVETSHVTMNYSGELAYQDKQTKAGDYTPVPEGEYKLNIPNVSGRYTEGNFSIAFLSVPLDGDGYIVGGGDLLNVELIVPNSPHVDYSTLAGTYTYADFDGGVFNPGNFVGGKYYNMLGDLYAAIGTALTVYDEDGVEDMVGLSAGGTITVTDKGNGVFKFDFDLTTLEKAHLTGSWEGEIAKYITDFTTGISGASVSGGKVSVSGNIIHVSNFDSQEVQVYSLDGKRIAGGNGENLEVTVPFQGLYLLKCGGRTSKIVVK